MDHQQSYDTCLVLARDAIEGDKIADALSHLRRARAVPGFAKAPQSLDLLAAIGGRSRIKSFSEGWLKRTFKGHVNNVHSVSFSPDGRVALSGGMSSLRLWDVATGACLHTIDICDVHDIDAVAFSQDGRIAMLGTVQYCPSPDVIDKWDDEHELQLWDVANGKYLRAFAERVEGGNAVAFSPDGRLVLSASEDYRRPSRLRLWDVATAQCLRTFQDYGAHCVAFSPDGRVALSGGRNNLLVLWDVATGECLRTLEGHTEPVSAINFSPDGRVAGSGGRDKTVRLWDVTMGQCLKTCMGHEGTISSLAFSPDGRFGVSGSLDSTLRLWDVTRGISLQVLEGHTRVVNSVAFSPNGRFVLSGSEDHTLKLWEIDWEYEYDPEQDPVLKRPVRGQDAPSSGEIHT